MQPVYQMEYFNNTVGEYLQFFAVLLGGFLVTRLFGYLLTKAIKRKGEKTGLPFYDLLLHGVQKYLFPILYLALIVLSTRILTWNSTLEKILDTGILAAIAVYGALLASMIAVFFFQKYGPGSANAHVQKWMSGLIKVLIWGIAVILFLDNIGVKINSLIAGLGIGGLAIVFAAQTILADIFCFFTILFDRPFEIGDFITVGEQMGTVEHIGVKTTRLRALTGEQLIFSNGDLTGSRIQNYKTLEQRRVLFTLGVTYNTQADQLKEIPKLLREIIEQAPDTKFGRAHFASYGEFSLNFEVVYFVLNNDYDHYMDLHQEINLRIKEEFDKRKISFAFPTVTLDAQK